MHWHIPGNPSLGGVLDIGLKCTHSCKFCYYSFLDKTDDQFRGMRRASFRSLDDCKKILDLLKAQGIIHVDVTGGEPTLHPNIVDIVRYAREIGLAIRIITLGQFLKKKNMPGCEGKMQLDALLDAGVTNFLFSYHACAPDLFRTITGEDWNTLEESMTTLDSQGFSYTANTVVYAENYTHLPEIATHLVRKHSAHYMHNFIIMNAYYEWNKDGKAFGTQARYKDIFPYLLDAVATLEDNGRAVNIRYAPLCAVKGLERNLVGMVGNRWDPYEWRNAGGHFQGSTPEQAAALFPVQPLQGLANHHRQAGGKVFLDQCGTCAAQAVCDGVDVNYATQHGGDEFVPYRLGDVGP